MKKGTWIGVSFATSFALALAAFAGTPTSFTVTPSAGANGNITPNTPQLVAPGQTTALTVTPNAGFVALMKGSCGGTLTTATYTTQPVTSDCSVIATFSDVVFASNFETPPQSTTTTIISRGSSVVGQNYSISAVVTAASGTPDGTVSVADDAAPANICGPAVLASNVASCSIAWSAPGTYALSAVYSPGASGAYLASASEADVHVVNKASTTVALVSSGSPTVFEQPSTFTATVNITAPGSGVASGTVTFFDGATEIGGCVNESVASNVATCATSALPTVGSPHSITAVYSGDSNFNSSSPSNTVNQTVNPAATTTALTSDINPSVFGQNVTLTATIAVTSPGSGSPSGTVTFKDGAATFSCTVQSVTGSTATCVASTLTAAGSPHLITATYNGDSNF